MTTATVIRPIVATSISSHTLNAHILNALRRTEKKMLKDYEKTTATWTNKPTFDSKVTYAGGVAKVKVWTDDVIYGYIDRGTPVRYAKMTDDFVPKTVPGWIGSQQGAGGVWWISKKHPLPGIEARGFTVLIEGMALTFMIDELDDAFLKAISSVKGGFRR